MAYYSFDTGAFINGRRDLLPPRVFRTLWSNIEEMIADGMIRSVELVRDEVKRREDEVYKWTKEQIDLFVPLEHDIQEATTAILAKHPKLVGIGGQRSGADPFVIALAKVQGGTVITEEKLSRNLGKPKIPDVCADLGVPWQNLVGFVEAQGWTF